MVPWQQRLQGIKDTSEGKKTEESTFIASEFKFTGGEQHSQTENPSGKSLCCLLHCCFSSFCSVLLHWGVKAADVLWESPTETSSGQDFGTNLTCEGAHLRDDMASFLHFRVQEIFFVVQNYLAKARIQLSVSRKALAPNQMDDFTSLLKCKYSHCKQYFLHRVFVCLFVCF